MQHMSDPSRTRHRIALGLLVFAKVLGILALVIGSSYRVLGGVLLGFDALLIVTAVVLCLRIMKRRAREESEQKAMLRQMMREGTLKQYLRELESEVVAETTSPRDSGTLPHVAS